VTGPPGTLPTRLRSWLPYALLVAALAVVGIIIAQEPDDGPPLDPDSTGPAGTRALVETLERLGARVDISADTPARDATAVLVLADDLDEDGRDRAEAWAREGGTLVVADPGSPLAPDIVGTTQLGPVSTTLPRECDVAALADVQRVSAPGAAVIETPDAGAGCFPRGEGHWLVVEPLGDGALVALGGPGAFTNAVLGDADNAMLAAALLLGDPNPRVHLQQPPLPGSGDAGLLDLIPDRVIEALVQLLAAFLVFALWRSRRLGRPVEEVLPVALPGSELTLAFGNLMQSSGARQQAADLLRHDLAHALAERFGLPAAAPPDTLAQAAARAGADRERVLRVLTAPAPTDEAGLLAYAAAVDAVRAEAFATAHGDPGPPDTVPDRQGVLL
jgi:hypothetical protein